jgi:nitroimidazol reductase NimA-like FMN-containing flavoprotein (pyridoxamine 5'-phosphate oxidase superfamily)
MLIGRFKNSEEPRLSNGADNLSTFTPTERTTLKRLPKRAEYDHVAVYQILDEGFICHVAFAHDGKPVVIPTSYARIGDYLYIHGSAASRLLRSLEQGIDVCVTVTLIDGLVLARSAFHHSINYRSVVIFGNAMVVNDPDEKINVLRAFTDHVVPGRWDDIRLPNEGEMRATLVLKLPLVEVSAKVRTGPPIDDEEDYELPVWAGVVPLKLAAGTPIGDERLPSDIQAPGYVREYARPGSAGIPACPGLPESENSV